MRVNDKLVKKCGLFTFEYCKYALTKTMFCVQFFLKMKFCSYSSLIKKRQFSEEKKLSLSLFRLLWSHYSCMAKMFCMEAQGLNTFQSDLNKTKIYALVFWNHKKTFFEVCYLGLHFFTTTLQNKKFKFFNEKNIFENLRLYNFLIRRVKRGPN